MELFQCIRLSQSLLFVVFVFFVIGRELSPTERTRVMQLKPRRQALDVEFVSAVHFDRLIGHKLLQTNTTLLCLLEVIALLEVSDELLGSRRFSLLVAQERHDLRLEAHVLKHSGQRYVQIGRMLIAVVRLTAVLVEV